MRTPKILIVDDSPYIKRFAKLLTDLFGFRVCSPTSFDALRRCLFLETFDGAVIDMNLSEWDIDVNNPRRLNGVSVEDGLDVSKFYHKLHQEAAIGIYSVHASVNRNWLREKLKELSFPVIHIDAKPMPVSEKELKKKFDDFNSAVRESRNASSAAWLLDRREYKRSSFNERIQAYNRGLEANADWLAALFKELGEPAWVLVGDMEAKLYGPPLGKGGRVGNAFGLPQAERIREEDLDRIEKEDGVPPLPFWNLRGPGRLAAQFGLAGENLSNLPQRARDPFAVAVASPCADAYVEGSSKQVAQWCTHLKPDGQIKVAKEIFKRVRGAGQAAVEKFAKLFKESGLPVIIDFYEAKVRAIHEAEGEAWVALKRPGEDVDTVEPFDLELLKDNGLRYERQPFEYTVYKTPSGVLSMSVELSDVPETGLFTPALKPSTEDSRREPRA